MRFKQGKPSIQLLDNSATAVVSLPDEIDVDTLSRYRDEFVTMAEQVKSGVIARIVLDCSNTTFLDTSGLRVMLSLTKLMNRHPLPIVMPQGSARSNLERNPVFREFYTRFFRPYDSLEAVLQEAVA